MVGWRPGRSDAARPGPAWEGRNRKTVQEDGWGCAGSQLNDDGSDELAEKKKKNSDDGEFFPFRNSGYGTDSDTQNKN